MNQRLKYLSCATLCLSAFPALSMPITPDMALQRLLHSDRHAQRALSHESLRHIATMDEASEPTLYIFGNEKGFVVLSADDEVTSLLGYSDHAFSPDGNSPAFTGWLETFSREIKLVRNGEASAAKISRNNDFPSILPMCKTQWSQDEPFYNKCPKPAGAPHNCYTGCVATAMAQVMNYHEWPLSGTGKTELNWNNHNLKLDFSKQDYQYDLMLDKYIPGEYTQEEGNAVAILMKSCGFGVQMNYGTDASGALSQFIAPALGEYFRYDRSKLRFVMRDYFTLGEWEELIYNSLSSDGPVILDGQSNEGGHSFVCDGYDRDGYFHINWGWAGSSDGYFLLSALDPFDQGIGGSQDNSGFNYMQDAIIGISPARMDESETPGEDYWFGQLISYGDMGLDIEKEYLPGEETAPLCEKGVFNVGPSSIPSNTYIGLLFRDTKSDDFYISGGTFGTSVDIFYGFSKLELPMPEEIPDGDYIMTMSYYIPSYEGVIPGVKSQSVSPSTPNEVPETRDEEEEIEVPFNRWIDVLFPVSVPTKYEAAVRDGIIRFTPEEVREPSGVSELSVTEESKPRYFSLQGVELKTPVRGEVVIVVKGDKSYKTVLK